MFFLNFSNKMTENAHFVPNAPPPPTLPSITSQLIKMDNKTLVYNHLNSSSIGHSYLQDLQCIKSTIHQTRFLNNDGNRPRRFLVYLEPVTPVLQDGPKCGLVALSMAAQMLGHAQIDVNTVYTTARDQGYTKQGEMFSAQNMASLCGLLNCHQARVVEGGARKPELIRALCRGCPVLVPYDKDRNHEPCNQSGTKAHWALIAGLLLQINNTDITSIEQALSQLQQDSDDPSMYHTDNAKLLQTSIISNLPQDQLSDVITHVIAYQGKSLRPQLWSLDALLDSNAQLTKLDPEIDARLSDYVVPENGIECGLCNKIVVFE